MLISEENIQELIPQRYPMVMIDRLLACDEKKSVSQFTIHKDNLFLDRNGFTSPGMMENMAQTAAARIGYLLKNNKGNSTQRIPVGVIGSVKNFRMYSQPGIGDMITTTITVEHEVLQALVIKGKIELNGNMLAESDMQIFLTESQAD